MFGILISRLVSYYLRFVELIIAIIINEIKMLIVHSNFTTRTNLVLIDELFLSTRRHEFNLVIDDGVCLSNYSITIMIAKNCKLFC